MNRWVNYFLVVMSCICMSITSADPVNALVDKEFSLGIGQTANIAGEKLFIKFKSVLEDSRCPVNVVCVWAGNGKVEFEILDIDAHNKIVTLSTEDGPGSITLKGHKLTLIALTPSRVDGISISPGDYAVTLRFERKPTD